MIYQWNINFKYFACFLHDVCYVGATLDFLEHFIKQYYYVVHTRFPQIATMNEQQHTPKRRKLSNLKEYKDDGNEATSSSPVKNLDDTDLIPLLNYYYPITATMTPTTVTTMPPTTSPTTPIAILNSFAPGTSVLVKSRPSSLFLSPHDLSQEQQIPSSRNTPTNDTVFGTSEDESDDIVVFEKVVDITSAGKDETSTTTKRYADALLQRIISRAIENTERITKDSTATPTSTAIQNLTNALQLPISCQQHLGIFYMQLLESYVFEQNEIATMKLISMNSTTNVEYQ